MFDLAFPASCSLTPFSLMLALDVYSRKINLTYECFTTQYSPSQSDMPIVGELGALFHTAAICVLKARLLELCRWLWERVHRQLNASLEMT